MNAKEKNVEVLRALRDAMEKLGEASVEFHVHFVEHGQVDISLRNVVHKFCEGKWDIHRSLDARLKDFESMLRCDELRIEIEAPKDEKGDTE